MKIHGRGAPGAVRILFGASLLLSISHVAEAIPRHSRSLKALSASGPLGHIGVHHLGAEEQPRRGGGTQDTAHIETPRMGELGHVRADDLVDAVWPSSSLLTIGGLGWAGQVKKEEPMCGTTYARVTSNSTFHMRCPDSCPLMAKDKTKSHNHCKFQCVEEVDDCKALNPAEPVADDERGFCRQCMVNGCDLCTRGGKDTCEVCMAGFALDSTGNCYNKLWWVWYVIFVILGVVLVPLLIWNLDLSCRTITNQEGLDRGLHARSRAKFHMPVDPTNPEDQSKLYPWYTNLCREEIGGNGLLLHFNFQAVLIVWGLVVTAVWAGFIIFVSPDLAAIGLRMAKTPWENCWVVQWGLETQVRLMWTKIAFATFVYIFSFVGVILFGIRQLRITQLMDEAQTTHMDYCAVLTGIPPVAGTEKVEEELRKIIEDTTEANLVGVSVCWDMGEKADVCKSILEVELDARDNPEAEDDDEEQQNGQMTPGSGSLTPGLRSKRSVANEGGESLTVWRRVLNWFESMALSPGTQWFIGKCSGSKSTNDLKDLSETGKRSSAQTADAQREANRKSRAAPTPEPPTGSTSSAVTDASGEVIAQEVDTETMLKEFVTAGQAFVVFNTEVDRNKGVEAAANTPIVYRGCELTLKEKHCEPESNLWENYERIDNHTKVMRAVHGFGIIFASLMVWTFGFYLPYAYYAMSFNYAHGQEPGMIESLSFSMVVVAGNAVMYIVCSEVAERQRFGVVGDRETCYLLLYTFACVFNVVLDLYIAYRVAYRMMVGVDMKTYYGTSLKDVDSFAERFETYAMQRELGNTLMDYAFPSTFLIPFLIEPVVTILLPYQLMVWFVRTHPELTGLDCERCLAAAPLDLSRYADLLLNVILAVMILFFPGGFNIKMFLSLALSHIFIYAFDHWRVLYSVPRCTFSKINADWWAQWMCSIPCGLILFCIVFKANTEDLEEYQPEDAGQHHYAKERENVMLQGIIAFFIHIIVHTIVLVYVVPIFGKKSKEPSKMPYEYCGKRAPCSWFSSNPAYCLRSEHVYKHDPPSDFYIRGKEHLIRQNKSIGVYFHEIIKPQEEEGYGEMITKGVSSVASWIHQGDQSASARSQESKSQS